MSSELIQTAKRHKTFLVTASMAFAMGWAIYNGSHGYRELMEKRQQIREMQEQNVDLQKENEKRRERIERLSGNSSEQDMELRKLNLVKPGETIFILRDGTKASSPDGKEPSTSSPR